ncbi:ribonucleoside-diphosphate reductase, alpha subunit [Thermobaculum terrenum ATCC BAA-798]|uniref:Ribonucleoside-diphosphate reductase n=1 Tax=Thermobaculum terrenum (strain ATCC BAA-798 / CCMEE 7001 / YNP1) TaxID=525904 RepID=D1CID8_THET1|nr:ribonucleoside-diphosphate reductase subunit alpha [Thermobaculum terrenum]ACZ43509.1 ribonucleoside-diphosphate reductase, alpha subunit [Thermobaculum terrenum ATCC BAA-798]
MSTAIRELETQRVRVVSPEGGLVPLDPDRVRRHLQHACRGLPECDPDELANEVVRSLYDRVTPEQIRSAMILAARARIERDPAYDKVASRLMLEQIYQESWGWVPSEAELAATYREMFPRYVHACISAGRLSEELARFDLARLASALRPERDEKLRYIGLQTLYDRYLLDVEGRRLEAPQYFWMRVAMGLALREDDPNARAAQFYDLLSSLRFVSATPTLFNSGTPHPQLSSCYLSTVEDDLEHIFKVIGDNAKLSKWAGGLGNDWTRVRATGALIRGTHGKSQGVIPFLKIVNDTAVAVNQGGKRKGAVCCYLEPWHLDFEEFLELRKNTGDERRRTHDMHTASWVPDLFMRRVQEGGTWTLFSPNEVPDLHELYGRAFERRYVEYERMAEEGKLRQHKRVDAKMLWRKMLSMLWETGHPWIAFKDPSNIRSAQDHVGVIHSSNLCTEILLPTSREETAVCNLGSINLVEHLSGDGLDEAKLAETVRTAVRMLDNVIDINFYPTPEARRSNLRHRPIGLGIMGFHDALLALRIPYASPQAVEFSDQTMELISWHAIMASSELAAERGRYPSYQGSKWSRGLLPIDTIELLERERGGDLEMDRTARLDWGPVREAVARWGVRNSQIMAIAPTATISNIAGVSQSIEPHYRNLFVKSNLSGDFTIVNPYLVEDLKRLGLWSQEMLDRIKYYDGSILPIEEIPDEVKHLYLTAHEIDPLWLIECASRRQKWVDMGQSLNIYVAEPSGKKLHEIYFAAWRKGLKTTYYLRAVGATNVEKASMDINRFGVQPRWMRSRSASSRVRIVREGSTCQLGEDCEACQ